jgi:hypothetical protein
MADKKRVVLELSAADLHNLEVAVRLRLESEEDSREHAWFQRSRRWRRMLDIIHSGQRQLTAERDAKRRARQMKKYEVRA